MHRKPTKPGKILAGIAVLCLLVALCTTGGVYAYLVSVAPPLSNSFEPAVVTCDVEEVFTDGVKRDVRVRNTGNINAFIRAAVVVNFVSDDGKILATSPVPNTDYTVSWDASGWMQGADGYWYHRKAVAPDGLTAPLIKEAKALSAPAGYRLQIQIVAAAVQAAPSDAVGQAWGATVSDGELIPG